MVSGAGVPSHRGKDEVHSSQERWTIRHRGVEHAPNALKEIFFLKKIVSKEEKDDLQGCNIMIEVISEPIVHLDL